MTLISEFRYVVDKYGPGFKGLWRAGWNEVPTIMATLPFMFIGLAIGTVGIHLYNKYDYDNRQHKLRYVVYRPDDPRAEDVKRFLMYTRRPSYADGAEFKEGRFSQ